MNDQDQVRTVRTSKRQGRGCLWWLGAGLASLLGLMLVGYIYEGIAEAADTKTYPPPGELVDVGGYRLHINCTDTSPTVVIVAGAGDWSTTWGGCTTRMAKTTRVCTYDRLAWDGAKQLHFQEMQHNLPGSCIRCYKMPTSREPMSWSGIRSEVLSYVSLPTTMPQKLPGWCWSIR